MDVDWNIVYTVVKAFVIGCVLGVFLRACIGLARRFDPPDESRSGTGPPARPRPDEGKAKPPIVRIPMGPLRAKRRLWEMMQEQAMRNRGSGFPAGHYGRDRQPGEEMRPWPRGRGRSPWDESELPWDEM